LPASAPLPASVPSLASVPLPAPVPSAAVSAEALLSSADLAASVQSAAGGRRGRTILVARDAAFQFLYPENIRSLERLGKVRYFSPLADKILFNENGAAQAISRAEEDQLPFPDLVYLPGGYPEFHLEALAANSSMLQQLRLYYTSGGKILAECGGMMYLGESIADEKGIAFPMAAILKLSTSLEHKKLTLGYRTIKMKGYTLRGHEFHYSQFAGTIPASPVSDALVTNARQIVVDTPVFHDQQLLASYMHLYWAEQPSILEDWLGCQF
jgi:cobyrinic acid a,c-diamide synthase